MDINKLANQNIFNVKPYVPGKPIEEVKRELKLERVIKLASNENAFGPSPAALKAMRVALKGVHRYPDASGHYLKKKLAKKLKVPTDSIALGNGSDELIVLAIKAFVAPDDEVIIAHPTFLIYDIAARLAGAKIVTVPLKDSRYDLKAMKQAITKKTKMIFIANPDNPSGSYANTKEVASFLRVIPDSCIVFFDEAYYEFAAAKQDYPQTISQIKKHSVIVTRTFSKVYGLAGLRVGYAVSDPEIIGCIERVREPFNVNLMAQAAAVAALDDTSYLRRVVRMTEAGKKFIYGLCSSMGLTYVPSATNFVLIDLGRPADKVVKNLLKQGIIVRDMAVWGMTNCIRVTVGKPLENRRFARALKKAVNIS